ncbi:transposase [Chryseobacterium shigense]|uniref:Transcriptional regulator with PAS, ATPase and Fis domain n=1 Tax=Chryseobacterium shigense TaxID=297244 RepID=A0A841N6M7_9FLAO|nr:transposase [Chryseobacterium shigense]MBB6369118.1 transcriptional regulator with PAS, ATPase and Fis domain [Chryseobacterium shigense]
MVNKRVVECEVEVLRICKFFNCTEDEVLEMYNSKSLDSEILLKWSKILEYDFFRFYSQNLIFYSPASPGIKKRKKKADSQMPYFRKNIYTKEVINFILETIEKGEKTKSQVVNEYNIPKTTLYKWIEKSKK